jgi:hypothetical protein
LGREELETWFFLGDVVSVCLFGLNIEIANELVSRIWKLMADD